MTREEREQAIEVLQAKIDSIEDDQAYSQLSKSMYEDGYRRIDACKAAIAALREPEWVRTADRLPDDNKPVLVTYVGYTDNLPYADAIAVYAHEMADNYAGAWYWQDSDGVDDNPVSVSITHWMPIPPLPEVEG